MHRHNTTGHYPSQSDRAHADQVNWKGRQRNKSLSNMYQPTIPSDNRGTFNEYSHSHQPALPSSARNSFYKQRGGGYMEYHGSPSYVIDSMPLQPTGPHSNYMNENYYLSNHYDDFGRIYFPVDYHTHDNSRMLANGFQEMRRAFSKGAIMDSSEEFQFERRREVHHHGEGLQITVKNSIAEKRLNKNAAQEVRHYSQPLHLELSDAGNSNRLGIQMPIPPQTRRGGRGVQHGRWNSRENPGVTNRSVVNDTKRVHFSTQSTVDESSHLFSNNWREKSSKSDTETEPMDNRPISVTPRGRGRGRWIRGSDTRQRQSNLPNSNNADKFEAQSARGDSKQSRGPRRPFSRGRGRGRGGVTNSGTPENKVATVSDNTERKGGDKEDSRRMLTLTQSISLDIEHLPVVEGDDNVNVSDLELTEFDDLTLSVNEYEESEETTQEASNLLEVPKEADETTTSIVSDENKSIGNQDGSTVVVKETNVTSSNEAMNEKDTCPSSELLPKESGDVTKSTEPAPSIENASLNEGAKENPAPPQEVNLEVENNSKEN